ncbi:C-type lectin domain family 4 member D [Mytilus galloprovincialis]|nr:C-type lectin domain family 4 member D [Mytilus galloprovincialis]
MATYTEVSGKDICLAKKEENCFTILRNQLKRFENSISDLVKGLKEKTVISNVGCKKDWYRFKDHCYYLSKEKKSWFEAERYCRTEYSSLVTINDDNENNWLMSKLKANNVMSAWIGATDCDSDKWIWSSTFAPIKYSNWHSSEPNGYTKENCAAIYKKYNGKWIDGMCKYKSVFVCKRHITHTCRPLRDL